MSLHLSPRVPRPKNSRHAQPLWTLARQSVAFLALIGLLVTTIPLVSARSRIRLVRNSALPDQGPSKARPTTSALLQGNSQNRGMPPLPVNPPGVAPGRPPTKPEREAKVHKLELNPHDELTVEVGEQMVFSAVPLDQDGNTIHGLKADWNSSDSDVLSIDVDGEILAKKIGSTIVTATIANKKDKIRVNVVTRKK